jgi:hypothetical protein
MKVRLLLTLAAISFAVPALMAEDTMKAIRANEIVWQEHPGVHLVRAITSPILSGRSIDRVDAVGIP